jgi:DNA-binding NtrC family response regulator
MAHNSILIIDKDPATEEVIRKTLAKDFQLNFSDKKILDGKLDIQEQVLVILDYEKDGAALLKKLKLKEPSLKVLVLSREQKLAEVILAIKMGGTYFLNKPLREDTLRETVHHILEGMTFEMLEISGEYPWYLTTHPRVEELLRTAKNVALHTMDVILCGEQGTGKDALAGFIYQNMAGPQRQFASLNAGYFRGQAVETHFWSALREIYQEYESNIFGQREPLYSTLYIEGLETQDVYFRVSLLQWLKQKRLEAERNFQLPLRIILGVNSPETLQSVPQEILQNIIWLTLIPLRERREDIPLLLDYLIKKYNQEFLKKVKGCSLDVLKYLMSYTWPGNLRELQLMVQMVMSRIPAATHYIHTQDLPLTFGFMENTVPLKRFSAVNPLQDATAAFEQKVLGALLKQKGYDRDQTAEFLGEEPAVIEDKLVHYELVPAEGEG